MDENPSPKRFPVLEAAVASNSQLINAVDDPSFSQRTKIAEQNSPRTKRKVAPEKSTNPSPKKLRSGLRPSKTSTTTEAIEAAGPIFPQRMQSCVFVIDLNLAQLFLKENST
jgi:hypothetical protein